MVTIESLLHRRTDLSTFVVHFTRDTDQGRARNNLLNILKNCKIEALNAYGMGKDLAAKSSEIADTQRVVCFTETPLEHAWMMSADIEGRAVDISGYGIAFTKTFARRQGVNPVWYIDQTPGHDWLTVPINKLIKEAEEDPERLADAHILQLTPYIEQMGPMNLGGRKEFWWEREWRHVGNMRFEADDVVVIFAPEDRHKRLEPTIASYSKWRDVEPAIVDATWGLERMIGALACVTDTGPFPQ